MIPGSAGAYRVCQKSFTSSDSTGIEKPPGRGEVSAHMLQPGEWAYIESSDPGTDDPETVIYWLSEVSPKE